MRYLFLAFACLSLGFALTGCYLSHERSPFVMPAPDSGPVIGDAGPMPVPDAGPIAPDSGPVVVADAGSDAGMPPEPDAGSEPDAGPFMCPTVVPNYTLNIAASPRSSSVTAGTANVPSVGIVLSTPSDSGITYTTFAILGRGDTDGTFRTEHFRDVVTFCSIFEGDILVGGGAPDERGLILVDGFSRHLDMGSSANLRIECDADPDVAQLTGDRFVVSLNSLVRGVEPMTVTDDLGCPREAVWGRGLLNQADSTEPNVVITVTPGLCEGVDVPADGSGHVVVRVVGGGDMTVPPDTDFIAFSVIIENHMLTSVSAGTSTSGWHVSTDCTVARPSAALTNECDATNRFHPTGGSCGGGDCGYTCAEIGPVFASGTTTRFTAYAHTRASGTFGLALTSFVGSPTWIGFRDASGSVVSTDVVDGDEFSAHPVAIITVP